MNRYAWMLLISVLLLSGCTIKAPEIKVTGERTLLEEQILGTYQELKGDIWMIASRRSVDGDTIELSEARESVLQAIQTREFNRDDVNEFKQNGWLGESGDGLLILRDTLEATEAGQLQYVEEVMADENRARKIIMKRLYLLNQGSVTRVEVNSVYGKMMKEESPEGTWVQDSTGRWKRK